MINPDWKKFNEYSYVSEIQNKNIAWFLPRPRPDHYKGGMPLHAEEWLLKLGRTLLFETGFINSKNLNHKIKIMNLFCGMNKYGFRVDIKEEVNPDYICDAHDLFSKVGMRTRINSYGKFDIILADPPYSNKESEEIYGTGKLNYKKWTDECDKVLEVGGLLMIYHKYVMPNPDSNKYSVLKRIFIGNRPYHLPRACIIFRKNI
jgi:hypothetical protein